MNTVFCVNGRMELNIKRFELLKDDATNRRIPKTVMMSAGAFSPRRLRHG